MPTSTLNISTLEEIVGKCTAMDDPVFSFTQKGKSSYEVKVNFECLLNYTETKRLLTIDIVVTYEITIKVNSKTLDFTLTTISGVPSFVEKKPFVVEFIELAQFMVSETLALAKGGTVLGTGFEAELRRTPGAQVTEDYLFLYDLGTR